MGGTGEWGILGAFLSYSVGNGSSPNNSPSPSVISGTLKDNDNLFRIAGIMLHKFFWNLFCTTAE